MQLLNASFIAYFIFFLAGIFLFQRAIRLLNMDQRIVYMQFRMKQKRVYIIVLFFALLGYVALQFTNGAYFKPIVAIALSTTIITFAILHHQQNNFLENNNFDSTFKQWISINFVVDLLRQLAFLVILFLIINFYLL